MDIFDVKFCDKLQEVVKQKRLYICTTFFVWVEDGT